MTAQALTIATWNINSVRLRIDQVRRFLADAAPDVLCLQEIKCHESQFPTKAFEEAGYPHIAIAGQKGMHGVATVSRLPLEQRPGPDVCQRGEARCVVTAVNGVEVHNYYVPAGGDEPDPKINPKFAHKLDFIDRLTSQYRAGRTRLEKEAVIVTGDLNIAPGEHDVWSHKQLLKVVSHTPVETEGLKGVQDAGGFADLVRDAIPEPEKVFTWWSYRARDWRISNRGRRLDHIWLSPALARAQGDVARNAVAIHDACRDWEKPSDHAPVVGRVVV